MEQLKTCPFCKGKAGVYYTTDDVPNYFATNGRLKGKIVTYKVKCRKCLSMTGEYANPGQAMDAWNRRADNE